MTKLLTIVCSLAICGQALAQQPEVVLIDGNQVPPRLGCRAETIVGGDARSYSIAAASIIAKVKACTDEAALLGAAAALAEAAPAAIGGDPAGNPAGLPTPMALDGRRDERAAINAKRQRDADRWRGGVK